MKTRKSRGNTPHPREIALLQKALVVGLGCQHVRHSTASSEADYRNHPAPPLPAAQAVAPSACQPRAPARRRPAPGFRHAPPASARQRRPGLPGMRYRHHGSSAYLYVIQRANPPRASVFGRAKAPRQPTTERAGRLLRRPPRQRMRDAPRPTDQLQERDFADGRHGLLPGFKYATPACREHYHAAHPPPGPEPTRRSSRRMSVS